MRTYTLVIIPLLALFSFSASAQNMVPNPGFENYNSCPISLSAFAYSTTYGTFPYCQNWVNPSTFSSSDYFNSCAATTTSISVPVNFVGYEAAHGGQAYAGFYAWYSNYSTVGPYMEYVETKLTTPMVAGHSYLVSFWANLANNSFGSGLVGINTVAAHFSDTLLYDPTFTPFMVASPDVEDTTIFVSDTTNWVQIKGVYRAKSHEQFITIGHFYDSTKTQRYVLVGGSGSGNKISYVYVDDVSVTPYADSINRDTSFCTHTFPYTIKGLADSGIFRWNTGDTTQFITIDSAQWGGANDAVKSHWYVRHTLILPDSSIRMDSVLVMYTPTMHVIGGDATVCPGVPITRWATPATFDTYKWNNGSQKDTITVTAPATYVLTATNVCGSQVDSFHLYNYPIPPGPAVNDTTVCLNVTVPPLGVGGNDIKWYLHAGDTSGSNMQPTLRTTRLGYDTVFVTQTVNGCEGPKSRIVVHIIRTPQFQLGNDTEICRGKAVHIGTPKDSVDFVWSTGETGCCITVSQTGTYIVDGSNICGHHFDTLSVETFACDSCLWAPSAFTPNGDGRNDKFNIMVRCPVHNWTFIIYNRYGQAVFTDYKVKEGWDGTLHGVPQDPGVYFYFVQLETGIPGDEPKIIKGDVTLIR